MKVSTAHPPSTPLSTPPATPTAANPTPTTPSRTGGSLLKGLRSTKGDERYEGKIVSLTPVLGKDSAGWLVLVEIITPAQHRGVTLAHPFFFYKDRPTEWGDRLVELAALGVPPSDAYNGNIPQLLLNKEIRFAFQRGTDKAGVNYRLHDLTLLHPPPPLQAPTPTPETN